MSSFAPLRFTPWIGSPGLYSIHNADTLQVLDLENAEGENNKIHCCGGDSTLNISNPNQLWQLVIARDEKWLLINKRSGAYVAAPDAECSVVPQMGHPDWSSAHWRIVPAEHGGLWEVTFLNVGNPGSCLELESDGCGSGKVRISTRVKGSSGQTWYIKKQG